ncbi:MAG TPA: PilZ domain-containing protein [Candidatus Dormibacteraeota bacterium]|nr:PilZ domain-containing protein [Candidatus Dormibacteraeota bacterium]
MHPGDENPANRRRSKRVMLQVPVTVLTETPDREQVREETQTLVVNAHGGLLKLKMEVLAGQPLVLVNNKGVQEQCHVVRIDQPSPDYFAVAFQFDEPSPMFWPISFPPADWTAKKP